MTNEITIKSTGEKIKAYKLENGNWYDYDGMGANSPPTSKTGKREFTKEEIIIGKEVQ